MILKRTKLPISLINDKKSTERPHLLESHKSVFGKKKTRKRPNLKVSSMIEMAEKVLTDVSKYDPEKDRDHQNAKPDIDGEKTHLGDDRNFLTAGQSKRIWAELYKVIDSSDVILNVLDVRNPIGTRCKHVELYLKNEKPHKHLVFLLNKCDLVPPWVTKKWQAILSKERPTVAFHAGRFEKPFGKGALISLLRQFGKLHSDKKNISVGLVGYPNVGKSSVINALRNKKVCNVAPIPGETKVWQYITLMKSIFLVDCPGTVYNHTTDTDVETVLKGVVRTEYLQNPDVYVPEVMKKVKDDHLKRYYQIAEWKDTNDFIEQIARKGGRLLKGGEPDVRTVSVMILNDWQRGKLPYFENPDDILPPKPLEQMEKEPELNEEKQKLLNKRLELESKLTFMEQKYQDLDKNDEDEISEEDSEHPSIAKTETSDLMEMEDEDFPILEANDEEETALEKLDKQIDLLKKRNQATDESRVPIMEHVKKVAPYLDMMEDGYGATKAQKFSKKRNIDIGEEEKKARKMASNKRRKANKKANQAKKDS